MTANSPLWEMRFRAPAHTLPAWAKHDPEHCVFVANHTGKAEVYAWDRRRRGLRQVTDRRAGTTHCAIEAFGEWIWWFDDTDGDEFGVWKRQPFAGGADEPVSTELKPAWPAGLAIGVAGHALIGQAFPDGDTSIELIDADGYARTVYRSDKAAYAADLSYDLSLAAIEHSEDGDVRAMGVRVVTTTGHDVLDLVSGDHGFNAVGFAPLPGDTRLLVLHNGDGRWQPFILDTRTGQRDEIDLGLPGDCDLMWYPDARSLLVHHDFHARSELFRYDLSSRRLTSLNIPHGTVEDARVRPVGNVWFLWSNAAKATAFASIEDDQGPCLGGPRAPDSVRAAADWIEGPAGPIHVLISRPPARRPPYATVFLLHGGPEEQDRDRYEPEVAAWVDHDFAVVRINYRGSTGYGRDWVDAIKQRVGLTELEDVAAVRRWAVRTGLSDPRRLVLAGSSWGGYLTLLGVGVQPGDWAVALADAPIADYAMAYEDAMEEIRAMDRALFGGTPQDAAHRYRVSSPASHVEAVRTPAFISAGVNDPRCPIRQIDRYVRLLAAQGVPYEYHRYQAGHDQAVVDERIHLFRRQVAFTHHHLPG